MRYTNFWKSKRSLFLALACLALVVFFGNHTVVEKNVNDEKKVIATPTTLATRSSQICDDTSASHFIQDDVPQIFNCELNLSEEEASITVASDGISTITLTRDNKVLLSLVKDGGDDDEAFELATSTSRFGEKGSITFRDGAIQFIDVNFDGILDLQVLSFSAAYNEGYDFWIYDKKIHGYSRNSSLLNIVNIGFDPVSKTIISFDKGRGFSDYYIKKTYPFEGDTYVLIEEEVQEMYDKEPHYAYINTVTTYKNGAVVAIKKRKLTEEQVMGDKIRE